MLTPQERAALVRIEQQVLLEDPAFAARLRHLRPARARRPAVLVALGVISMAVGMAALIILGAAMLMGRPVPEPTVVGLSLLCLAAAVGTWCCASCPDPTWRDPGTVAAV